MRILTISIVSMFLLSGCNFFDNLTPADKMAIIYNTSKTATIMGIELGTDDNNEKVEIARDCVEYANLVLNVVNSDIQMNNGDIGSLISDFGLTDNPVFKSQIESAANILFVYVSARLDNDILDEQDKEYLSAFLNGVIDGAENIISIYNPNVRSKV